MSSLSTIRNMHDLEYQRRLLQRKADQQERKLRQDAEAIKSDYMPVINTVNGIRNGLTRLKFITSILLPVIRFFRNRRQARKR